MRNGEEKRGIGRKKARKKNRIKKETTDNSTRLEWLWIAKVIISGIEREG